MTTYNTGNPLGSAAPEDLYDNAQNLDTFVNDRVLEVANDRFGRPRRTWYGIERKAEIDTQAAADAATQLSEGYRDQAEVARDGSENARDDAIAAAGAIGPIKFFDSYADAVSGIATIPTDWQALVLSDETRDGARTQYKVVANALVFTVNLDQLRIDLKNPNKGAEIVVNIPGQTVAEALRERVFSVFSVVQLRQLNEAPHGAIISVHQYHDNVLLARPTGGGELWVDRRDTSTPDDGAITFVLADGARAKRRVNGKAWANWWGTTGLGVTSDSALIQKAVDYVGDKIKLVFDPYDVHLFTTPVVATAQLYACAESVKGLIGTTVFDGAGLPDGETCLYLNRPYSKVSGIKFKGKGRQVNALNLGREVGGSIFAAHSTVVDSCEFELCRVAFVSKYACHVRSVSCKFESCWKGFELDATSNTWKIIKAVAFNFVALTSHSLVHVKDADQLTIEHLWSELGSAPVVIAERFTNISVNHSWIEHLVIGNAQPLFIVNGSARQNAANFLVFDTDLITNTPILATLSNLENFELRNIRSTGLRATTSTVFPIINCTEVRLVKMESVYSEYVDQPARSSNRIKVVGANRVIRDGVDETIARKAYENKVFDSSFKKISSVVATGDAVATIDTTLGISDSSSLKVAFGVAGTGRVRTANPVTLVAGQHVRISANLLTDIDTDFNNVILRVAGQTSGKNAVIPLTQEYARHDITWQVPAGAGGEYYLFIDYAPITVRRAINVWVEDVMFIVSDQPIPYTPYIQNNSSTAPASGGPGQILNEHTFLGRRITSGPDTPANGRVGDIHYHMPPVAGGSMGVVNTTTGWKSFGAISA